MKKTLKLNVAANPADHFQTVKVSVIEQSHRGGNFGAASTSFIASNGVRITSLGYPSISIDAFRTELYVRGDGTAADNREILVPVAKLPAIEAAVAEYNKKFTFTPKTPAAVQHLKVNVEGNPADHFQTVKVTVLSQTHILTDFGTETAKGCGEFVHGKIRLCSSSQDNVGFGTYVPSRLKAQGVVGTFYVGRNVWQPASTFTGTIPANLAKDLGDAINAYNKKFAAPVPVAPAGCSFILG